MRFAHIHDVQLLSTVQALFQFFSMLYFPICIKNLAVNDPPSYELFMSCVVLCNWRRVFHGLNRSQPDIDAFTGADHVEIA